MAVVNVPVFRCALALSLGLPIPAQSIFLNDQSPTILDRALILRSDEFNRTAVKGLARQFLRDYGLNHVLVRLTIGTDKKMLARSFYHGTPHNTYRSTMEGINKVGLPRGPLARMIAVKNVALLSYLEEGAYSEELLSGTADPTVFHEGGVDYQLLHFRLVKIGATLTPGQYDLTLFLRASRVSVSSCSKIIRHFQKLTMISNVAVLVRPDAWFMESQQYPDVLPFVPKIVVPNEFQYTVAGRLSCGIKNNQLRCTGQNFIP